jgi:replicative DNA helicase
MPSQKDSLTLSSMILNHDNAAEMAVLASIMYDRSAFISAKRHIADEKYFYSYRNRIVWKAISEMIRADIPIDPLTLSDKLLKEIREEKISALYFSEITDSIATSAHCEHYAGIVAENFRVRELLRAYIEATGALNENADSKAVWEDVSRKTTGLFREKEKEFTIHDLMDELEKVPAHGQWGIPWHIPSLDEYVKEFAPGSVIILGARPGHGKTTLLIQLAELWANDGHKIFFQSMEMSVKEIYLRRMARLSGVPMWKIKRGPHYFENRENPDYDHLIENSASKIYDSRDRFIVSDRAGLSPEEIALNIRIAYETHGINFFALDHFHRVNFSANMRDMRHAQEEGLELILSTCRNLEITPIILAQLNRAVESRDSQELQLTDLRDCGRLEEAANLVLLMYWKYQHTQKPEDKHRLKIKCAKNRDGRTGSMQIEFIPETYSFLRDFTKEEQIK